MNSQSKPSVWADLAGLSVTWEDSQIRQTSYTQVCNPNWTCWKRKQKLLQQNSALCVLNYLEIIYVYCHHTLFFHSDHTSDIFFVHSDQKFKVTEIKELPSETRCWYIQSFIIIPQNIFFKSHQKNIDITFCDMALLQFGLQIFLFPN